MPVLLLLVVASLHVLVLVLYYSTSIHLRPPNAFSLNDDTKLTVYAGETTTTPRRRRPPLAARSSNNDSGKEAAIEKATSIAAGGLLFLLLLAHCGSSRFIKESSEVARGCPARLPLDLLLHLAHLPTKPRIT